MFWGSREGRAPGVPSHFCCKALSWGLGEEVPVSLPPEACWDLLWLLFSRRYSLFAQEVRLTPQRPGVWWLRELLGVCVQCGIVKMFEVSQAPRKLGENKVRLVLYK